MRALLRLPLVKLRFPSIQDRLTDRPQCTGCLTDTSLADEWVLFECIYLTIDYLILITSSTHDEP